MNLLREVAQVLIEMKHLANGRAGRPPDAVRVTDSEPDYTPRSDGKTLFEEYAGPEGELTRLVYRMQRDLHRFKHSRGVERKEDRDKRIVEEYRGWPATKVSEWENLSHTSIRRIREQAGKRPTDGY